MVGEIGRFASDHINSTDRFDRRSRDFWTARYQANISEGRRSDSKGEHVWTAGRC